MGQLHDFVGNWSKIEEAFGSMFSEFMIDPDWFVYDMMLMYGFRAVYFEFCTVKVTYIRSICCVVLYCHGRRMELTV